MRKNKEKSSQRKAKALRRLTETGQYSAEYSLQLCEDYHDRGLLTDSDYEEVAEFIEDLLNQEVEETQEETSTVEEISEENEENYDEDIESAE